MTEPNTWSWDWGFLSSPWRVIDFIDQLQISTGRWAMLLAMESQRTGRNPTAAIARASLSLSFSLAKNVQGVDWGDGECQWSSHTSAVADMETQLFEIALPLVKNNIFKNMKVE